MNRKGDNRGFSMAEMLITVAILAVLAGLAFIGVAQYRKSMHQLEMDAIAKQIFIAAQNHLSTAESQAFLNLEPVSDQPHDESFGYKETKNSKYTGVYYFVYGQGEGSDSPTNPNSLLSFMLPLGSVDDTARLGGSYIIRYQKNPAVVLDVFYTTRSDRYSHVFKADELDTALELRDTSTKSNKDARKDCFKDHAIMGWYGGENLPSGADLKAPTVTVRNAETLTVVIKNDKNSDCIHQLIVKGLTSGETEVLTYTPDSSGEYTFVLDDICENENKNKHFAEIFTKILLGENISVQAKVFSDSVLTNVATSELKITNSLFDDATTVDSSKNANAAISNIRHLENLSVNISKCGYTGAANSVVLKNALQINDLDWNLFPSAGNHSSVKIRPLLGSTLAAELFSAVSPAKQIVYDGGFHKISGIVVDETVTDNNMINNGYAGLFTVLPSGSFVKNLELVEVSASGRISAGALAGKTDGATITNVLARNYVSGIDGSKASTATGIQASSSGNAGGLIGEMVGGTITNCATAVIVNGGAFVGGLIGTASGTITACYSGGHTNHGEYYLHNTDGDRTSALYNVTGGTAGGLVGSFSGTSIENSYSTCSVSGTSTAGGFVGKNVSGSITNSYCTGLVSGDGRQYAFVGDGTASVSGCHYYEIINENLSSTTDKYMPPYENYEVDRDQGKIVSIDHETSTYNKFVGSPTDPVTVDDMTLAPWTKAEPYDSTLGNYYQGKYNLRSVARLGVTVPANYYVNTHYGDWPAPEIFVINTPEQPSH